MNERPIEAGEKRCPLTRSDWIVFLTAKSQTIHGYKYLVVTLLLVALSILMKVFKRTSFETFGLSELLISVAFVAVICYAIGTRSMLKERDENLEIIKEIIAGDLTDSDEITDSDKIRERYLRTQKNS